MLRHVEWTRTGSSVPCKKNFDIIWVFWTEVSDFSPREVWCQPWSPAKRGKFLLRSSWKRDVRRTQLSEAVAREFLNNTFATRAEWPGRTARSLSAEERARIHAEGHIHRWRFWQGDSPTHEQFLATYAECTACHSKNVGCAWVARVQGLLDYIAWNQIMTDSSKGVCQEWTDEMARTRNGGLEWPEMPKTMAAGRFKRSILYMNRVLLCSDPSKNISRGYLPPLVYTHVILVVTRIVAGGFACPTSITDAP